MDKWISLSERIRLLNDLKIWKRPEEAVSFWKERNRALSVTDGETVVAVEDETEQELTERVSCDVQQQSRWI